MECKKCGGKVDKITEGNYFCRECGARHNNAMRVRFEKGTSETPVQVTYGRGTSGLLKVVIILNYVVMVLGILGGLFVFGLLLIAFYYFDVISLIPFLLAAFLYWINAGLKKFDSSRRKYSIIANVLILIVFAYGFLGGFGFIVVFMLAIVAFQYYVLYMHPPTIAIFA